MKVFGNDISDVKAFGNNVVKIMAYGETVWEKQTSIPDYLCFTALESGTFTLTIPAAVTATELAYVEYSKNGRAWTRLSNVESTQVSTSVNVSQDDVVYWRGSGLSTGCTNSKESGEHTNFSSTADFNVSGNIMSLLYPTDFDNVTSFEADNGFCNLFKGNTHLISAADLLLPVTTATNYCYFGMFRNCSHMTIAPAIGLTSFASKSMVCRSMFNGCSSLVVAPVLSVATLAYQCYYYMFYGCSSLNYIKCLATDISATNCLNYWVGNVATNGTFIQASGVSWPSGTSGIPTTWLAVNNGSTFPNNATACDYIIKNNTQTTAAIVAVGELSRANEEWEVGFQATEVATSDRAIAGYSLKDDNVTPSQASQSYVYLRVNPDSFQHQCYRINGNSYSSSNGLLKSVRDTDYHTFRIKYTENGDHNYMRSFVWDGNVVSNTTVIYNHPLIGTPIWLFGVNQTNYFHYGKIYYFKWYEEDGVTLKADLVPCVRNSDSAAGFWDKTRLQFFTNTYWSAGYNT